MLIRSILTFLFFSFFNAVVFADDAGLHYPHYEMNNIGCLSCHYEVTEDVPDWLTHEPQDLDDTPYNNLCRSCHNDVIAPNVNPHSSQTTSNRYHQEDGGWAIECRECHWPHHQLQVVAYGSDSYLYSGVSTDVTATTLTEVGAGWSDDQYNNKILVPNVNQPSYNYLITDTTSDTLTVEISGSHPEPIDLIKTSVGDTFAIIYGNLIRSTIPTPYSGYKEVRFFNNNGTNSFADGDSTRDGVCEVCHTEANHFRNTGEINAGAGGYDHTAVAGTNCITCHPHTSGFAHGNGTGSGDCWECHGHDEGYDDATYGVVTGGKGSFKSHSTHTENDSDDIKGPNVSCDECHDTGNFPYFKSGTDSNSDGLISLSETDVCNTCHSPGGTYDGVSDSVLGAKNNWDNSIYEADSETLQTGKEKWCATCHDEEASVIGGITAPNVIGDEDGSYTYGSGWGFYKTGHGLASGEAYPYKGGLMEPSLVNDATRPVTCDSCHDLSTAHIDGNARTYDDGDSSSTDPSVYRQAYRLDLVPVSQGTGVSGREPLLVPWPTNTANAFNNSRLCFDCHDSGPFLNSSDMDTNLVTVGVNRHEYHLIINSYQYPADWSGGNTSRMTCVVCHNVHGSTWLAMIRDGSLTGRQPGLKIWYKNDAITTNIGTPNPPVPEDLPLAASDGTAWINNTVHNLCVGCHSNGNLEGEDRAPFQESSQVPTLDWTGQTGYVTDGADPDSAPSGSTFIFRVKYTDFNNDAPASINLLVDTDNDGNVDDTYPMAEADIGDVNYMNGVIYTKPLVLTDASGTTIGYKFEASDGTDAATGGPVGWSAVSLAGQVNHAPELAWVSDTCRYQGVSPVTAVSGTDFEFYVSYTDQDDQFDSLQVWVDLNDDGDYDDTDEKQDMVVDGGDGDYTNGENLSKTVTLSYAGDGMLNYRFVASDGTYAAVGNPAGVQSVTVIDSGVTPVTVCASGCDETTIQAGIDAALSGDRITLVSAGTYNENLSLTSSSWNNSKFHAVCGPDETTISSTGDIVFLQNVSGVHIDGFEITGGTRGVYSNGAPATINNCKIHDNNNTEEGGAGLYSINAAQTVTNSEIYSNTSSGNGGGVSLPSVAGHSFVNTIIRDNESTAGGGGAVFTQNGSTTFTDVTIKDNTSATVGGGVYANSSDTTFSRCTITGNTATSSLGGALYNSNSGCDAVFENCIIAGNSAANAGAVNVNQGTLSIVNSTLADNQATAGDGGAIKTNTGTTTIRNSILWGNSASGSGHIAYNTGSMTITDTVIASGSDGVPSNAPYIAGTVTPTVSGYVSENDPLFVDSANNNYHIKSTSDAIDNANATYAPDDDIDGDTRPQSAADDIGADEYLATINAPELSWTGETGYTADGVDPNSGTSGSTFTFEVDYTDADNNSPTIIQVWIDEDDDGAYGSNEKYDMTGTDGGDTDYTDGKRYAKAVVLTYAGDGGLTYLFYASDGIFGATGDPTANSVLTVTNNVPTLAWTGETNYTADGVNPNSGTGGDTFTFRVDYTDADNSAPSSIQVWVDEDDSETYEANEKHDLTAVDGGDSDYTDGKRYSTDLMLLSSGDGVLNYRFYATDGSDSATGNPTSDAAVSVANSVPTLAWTGEADYTTDGVDPDSDGDGSTFTFRIDYTDADNTAPATIQVWVDEDDSGDYEADEKYDMTVVDGGDSDYTDGKRYTKDMALAYTSDGAYPYRFYATDGAIAATGDPTADSTVTVTFVPNEAPTLDWTGESNYTTDGVDPESDLADSTFTFRVKYTDSNNDSPTSIQVWIDEDDNSSYEEDEKYDMTEVDAGDILYTDGKLYTVDRAVGYAGDGVLHYRFHANDGEADATANDPVTTTSATLTIINPITVCASGADFTSIQTAIDDGGTSSGDYIRVCNGTYSENINFNGKNVIVYSMNGAAATTIQGSGANSPVLTFSNGETASAVLDGFTIDNQNSGGAGAYGIKITSSSAPTIKNSVIKGNVPASYVNGAGIYIDGGAATIEDCTIGDATDQNQCRYGSAIYAINGGDDLTVTGSTLLSNVAANEGGAIYLSGRTSTTTLTDTTVSGNSAGQHGGAIRCVNSALVLNNSTIDSNTGIASYGVGGGIYVSGASAILSTTSGTTISNNDAKVGGGIQASGGAQLTISGTIIEENTARGGTGGGLNIADAATVVDIFKTWIRGNTAMTYGGGIYNSTATTTLTNCMVTGNLAEGVSYNDGGGINNAGTMYVYSSSIVGNRTGRNGGGWSGGGTITNSIVWGNSAGGTGQQINGSPTVTYSDVAGGFTGTGNIDSDPCFVDLQIASAGNPTTAGNFHICNDVDDPVAGCTGTSGVIDVGTSTDAPADDFDGDSRPQVSGYDMGADEYESAEITVSFTSASQATADESGAVTITAELSAVSGSDVTIPFTVNGASTASSSGTDYSITVSPVTITAGNTTADITVTIATDGLDEDNETVIVDMGTPTNASQGGPTTHTVTITDDDATPTVTFTSASQATANESGTATITAELSAASGRDVTVPFTVNGSSTATGGDTDYSITASPLTMSAGNTTAEITVTIASDDFDEDNETVIVDMGIPTNASQGATTIHTVTITDDDAAPSVTFTSASQATADESGIATITAELSAVSGRDVTMPFIVNGTSTADGGGTDYSISSSPLTITAGNTSADITVTIATDSDIEGDETVIVNMGTPSNATQGVTTTHTVTITDDDAALPTVTFSSASQSTVDESGVATITVELSAVSGSDVTVPFTVNGASTATGGGTDYSITASPATITAGNTSVDITVTVTTDSDDEGDETVIVDMGSPTNATQGATTTHTLTITDDDSASGSTYTVCPAGHADAPCDYETINAGIDDAGVIDGDTLLVSADTYSENINFDGKDITIRSAGGAASTTIQGDGSNAPVVSFGTSETTDAVLDGFTIDNQTASSSTRGVYIYGASPTVKNCTIQNNAANNSSVDGVNVGGGGIFVKNGAPTIDNCAISGNTSENRNGAGIYCAGTTDGTIIQNSTVSSNNAKQYGGGIYADVGLTLINTDISANVVASYGYGGGMYLTGTDKVTTYTGGSLSGLTAQNGGGVYISGGADLTIDGGAVISGNTASNGSGTGTGGGVYINGTGSTLTCSKAFLKGNDADQYGGAVYNNGGGLTMTNCNVTGNTADGQTYGRGGGIYTTGTATVDIYSSTIAGNYAYYAGGGLYHNGGITTATNSIFWDNTTDDRDPEIYGTITATYSDIEGGYSGTGNINLDPNFVTPAAAANGIPTIDGNFLLQAGSNVIDVGGGVDDIEPDPPTDDIEGNSRPQGSGYDMGADEYM
ncbi:MAG: right-handed parallel beta-helix repeat-containing protein [Desulfobulbaceae bacterium]|nr:right-handed parallel beta-helix repeat-containing protein [Desulfobulbaceae bacterium]